MTITSDTNDREYSGIIVRVANSPTYRLIAPDNSTVESWSDKPSIKTAKKSLENNGYDASYHIPFRDMTITDESLPDALTAP